MVGVVCPSVGLYFVQHPHALGRFAMLHHEESEVVTEDAGLLLIRRPERALPIEVIGEVHRGTHTINNTGLGDERLLVLVSHCFGSLMGMIALG